MRPLRLVASAGEVAAADVIYQVQPYCFKAASCWVAACLQAAARVPLVAGLSANFFHESRHCFTALWNWVRAASGTLLLTQASYLAMKSSQSATPIFWPAAAVVDGVVEAGVDAVLLVLLVIVLLFSDDPLHPIKMTAHSTQEIRRHILNIGVTP